MKRLTNEEKKRILEFFAVIGITVVLLLITRLETRLFTISESLSGNTDFYKTLIHFALININVVLILLLGFLIFRNVIKLVVERRRGVFGSRLRTKLVLALILFALMPTVLLFYVSTHFITRSFDQFFSKKISQTIQETKEVGAKVYDQSQRRMASLSLIAVERINVLPSESTLSENSFKLDTRGLSNFGLKYGVDSISIFDANSRLLWVDQGTPSGPSIFDQDSFVKTAIQQFLFEKDRDYLINLKSVDDYDLVQAAAPYFHPFTKDLLGIVLVREKFEIQILQSIETILAEFASLKPSAQSVGLSFMVSMVLMTLLIVFSATWLGFNVAKGVAGPLQSLSEATREVALGNYEITLTTESDDEVGQLVRAFNVMTRDLQVHRIKTQSAQDDLQHTNDQLFQRSQYLEIVLRSIASGVFSIDLYERVISFNTAAENLLGLSSKKLLGQPLKEVLESELYKTFWLSLQSDLIAKDVSQKKVDLSSLGRDVILTVDATPLQDDQGQVVGTIVVFDDIREKIQAQRVEAWREVARRIAHEIKNPITPIKLSAQRLLRRYHGFFKGEDQEIYVSCIETIIAQVDSLRDLVNEFSKFARLPKVTLKKGDLVSLIDEVVNFYEMSYSHIDFVSSGETDLPSIHYDQEQMRRVFGNLISNSIGAMVDDRQGKIEVVKKLDRSIGIVRIEVCDNGIGIDPKMRSRVLEPYYSTKDEGTGLGLAIVNQIVSDHGGYLRIKSQVPHGTKIVIELPLESKMS